MRTCLMMLGIVRTLVGRDYRSRGKRRELRRLGREFLRESADRLRTEDPGTTGETLRAHSNANSR